MNRGDERKLAIQWKPQFTLPIEKELDEKLHETVYTVDYQDIRIIVLNSNGMLKEQTQYVEQQLKNQLLMEYYYMPSFGILTS